MLDSVSEADDAVLADPDRLRQLDLAVLDDERRLLGTSSARPLQPDDGGRLGSDAGEDAGQAAGVDGQLEPEFHAVGLGRDGHRCVHAVGEESGDLADGRTEVVQVQQVADAGIAAGLGERHLGEDGGRPCGVRTHEQCRPAGRCVQLVVAAERLTRARRILAERALPLRLYTLSIPRSGQPANEPLTNLLGRDAAITAEALLIAQLLGPEPAERAYRWVKGRRRAARCDWWARLARGGRERDGDAAIAAVALAWALEPLASAQAAEHSSSRRADVTVTLCASAVLQFGLAVQAAQAAQTLTRLQVTTFAPVLMLLGAILIRPRDPLQALRNAGFAAIGWGALAAWALWHRWLLAQPPSVPGGSQIASALAAANDRMMPYLYGHNWPAPLDRLALDATTLRTTVLGVAGILIVGGLPGLEQRWWDTSGGGHGRVPRVVRSVVAIAAIALIVRQFHG
jgi:hypothetical protein